MVGDKRWTQDVGQQWVQYLMGQKDVESELPKDPESYFETVSRLIGDPGRKWKDVLDAECWLMAARARAEGVGAIRYDKDKVLGGVHADMADKLSDIMGREQDLATALTVYHCSVMSFRYVLSRAKAMGFIDDETEQMFKEYYEQGVGTVSLQEIADKHDLPKNRVAYLIANREARAKFCLAVDQAIDEADYTMAEEDYDEMENEEREAMIGW